MADPTPALDGGSEPMIDSVAGRIVSAMPADQAEADEDAHVAVADGDGRDDGEPAGGEQHRRSPPRAWCRPARPGGGPAGRSPPSAAPSAASGRRTRGPSSRGRVCRYCVPRNIWPYMAKNTRRDGDVGRREPAVLEEVGWTGQAPTDDERDEHEDPEPSEATSWWLAQPLAGASMIAHSTATSPTIERPAPTRSRRGASASRDDGSRYDRRRRATAMTGTLTKDAPQEKCWSRKPPMTGRGRRWRRRRRPTRRWPGPVRGSRKMLVSSESVAGMIRAAPTPIDARVKISWVGFWARPESMEPTPKMPSPTMGAARTVAHAAHGEQQPGEHERVAVDDPLQLAGGGVEIADQRRDRHVQDGVVERDDEQGDADRQRPPPPFVDPGVIHGGSPPSGRAPAATPPRRTTPCWNAADSGRPITYTRWCRPITKLAAASAVRRRRAHRCRARRGRGPARAPGPARPTGVRRTSR